MFKGTKNIIVFEQSLHFVLSPGADPHWFPPFYTSLINNNNKNTFHVEIER